MGLELKTTTVLNNISQGTKVLNVITCDSVTFTCQVSNDTLGMGKTVPPSMVKNTKWHLFSYRIHIALSNKDKFHIGHFLHIKPGSHQVAPLGVHFNSFHVICKDAPPTELTEESSKKGKSQQQVGFKPTTYRHMLSAFPLGWNYGSTSRLWVWIVSGAFFLFWNIELLS